MNEITPNSGVSSQGTSSQIEHLDFKAFEQASKTEQAGQNRAALAAALSAAGLPASPQDIELGRRMYEVAQAHAEKSGQTMPPFEEFAKVFASQLKQGGEEYRKNSWLAVQAFYGGRYAPPEYQATPEQLGLQAQPVTGPLVAPPSQGNGQSGTITQPATSDVPPPGQVDVPATSPELVAPTNQGIQPSDDVSSDESAPQPVLNSTNGNGSIVPGVVDPNRSLTPSGAN